MPLDEGPPRRYTKRGHGPGGKERRAYHQPPLPPMPWAMAHILPVPSSYYECYLLLRLRPRLVTLLSPPTLVTPSSSLSSLRSSLRSSLSLLSSSSSSILLPSRLAAAAAPDVASPSM